MKKLDFNIPFSSFADTSFINCFTSVYMYIEGISESEDSTYCSQWETGQCSSCGNCATKPQAIQERFFFLFDTICGRSSLRCHFDETPTAGERLVCGNGMYEGASENNIDFLFGFSGWQYRTVNDKAELRDEIIASIDASKPVIVKLDGTCPVSCAVIIGYDDSGFICPDYRCAQQCLDRAPTIDEIAAVYIIGEKQAPRYTLIDGLKRIESIMQSNFDEGVWDEYMERMGKYGPNGLDSVDIEGKKARMARVAATMWHVFNCHNFAEVFRAYRDGNSALYDRVNDMSRLNAPEIKDALFKIGGPFYGYTHDIAWSLIGLNDCAEWSAHPAGYYGEMIELVLDRIKLNDAGVLECIRAIIAALQ